MSGGKLFHALGPATQNARLPRRRLVRGTVTFYVTAHAGYFNVSNKKVLRASYLHQVKCSFVIGKGMRREMTRLQKPQNATRNLWQTGSICASDVFCKLLGIR